MIIAKDLMRWARDRVKGLTLKTKIDLLGNGKPLFGTFFAVFIHQEAIIMEV